MLNRLSNSLERVRRTEPRGGCVPARNFLASAKPTPWWRLITRSPLFFAAFFLPFANGGQSIPIAAWLSAILLLRFTRTHKALVALPILFATQVLAFAFQFRGMIPLPPAIQIMVILFYGLSFSLPYVGDYFITRRLRGFSRSLIFPLCWVGTEFLVSLGPFGSWCSVAYSQFGNLALLQVLALTGIFGVTFLIGWSASAANAWWAARFSTQGIPKETLACALLVAAVVLGGSLRLVLLPPAGRTVRIAALTKSDLALHPDDQVVGRFKAHLPLSPAEVDTIRERAETIANDLLLRSEREARAGAQIIFWGEGNAVVFKENEAELIRRGIAMAKENKIYLGMALASWHLETTPHLENKIVLVKPDGAIGFQFLKAHPVPGREAAISLRGDGQLPSLDTIYGRLGAAICFDADFPRFFRQPRASHLDLLLDPSNDWKAIDPFHTRMASFRAIEQGFNLLRATSHGLSAAYDYQGRELAVMDYFASDNKTLVAQIPTSGSPTIYARFGDWFSWGCLGWLAVLCIRAGRRQATWQIVI